MFDAVAIRRKYVTKVRQKRAEMEALTTERAALEGRIGEIDGQLSQLQVQLAAWDELIADLSRPTGSGARPTQAVLRPGTTLGKVYEVLRAEGRPLHIQEILDRIGRERSRKNRASLSGTLGSYVRDSTAFTRPAPNTFGLLEWSGGEPPVRDPQPRDPEFRLPKGFGDTDGTPGS